MDASLIVPLIARVSSVPSSALPSSMSGPEAAADSKEIEDPRALRLFERWQKTFLGAIDKQSEEYVVNMLREGEALIASGALSLNRSIKPASGSTFLHTVAWFQKGRVIEWLLQQGADPNQGNMKGNTPFHLLCENANKDIAPQLIQLMIGQQKAATQWQQQVILSSRLSHSAPSALSSPLFLSM
jgi:hypothetical protein